MMRRMPPPPRWIAIVNPASGGGGARRRWPRLARALARAGIRCEAAVTRAPGEAARMAGDALRAGFRRLLVAGGDGTLHEAVNGLQGLPGAAEVAIAAAAFGSGNDWAATQGMPRDHGRLAAAMARDRLRRVDLGHATCALADGGSRALVFHTLAGAGLDALVIRRTPARGPRALAYLAGLARALAAFEPPRFRVGAGDWRHEGPCLLAIAAIGPRCGGGMRLAPAALADDGRLDVVAVERMGTLHMLALAPGLYAGRAALDRTFRTTRCREARIESEPGSEAEADGELIGRTPLAVRVLPAALGVLDCRPGAGPD